MKGPQVKVVSDEVDAAPGSAASIESQQAQTPAGRRELAGRLAGLPLSRQVFVLAVWPLLEQLLNFLVSFVDTALAGHLSVEAANAIGVAGYFGWLIGLVQASVGIGATALIARAVGGRHKRLANAALGQAMILGLLAGFGIGALLFSLAPWIAWVIGLDDASARLCVLYLRILAAAAPMSAILFIGSACLRGAGDTRSPFLVLVVVNVVNTLVSLLLVLGPAPIGGHGVAGIAWGTFAAWTIGAAVALVPLIGGWGGIRLRWIRLRPHPATIVRLVRVGAPSFAEMFFCMWLANFFILIIVGKLGDPTAWGANMIAIRAEAISYMPGFALGIAAMTLCGQYLGLGDPHRARQAIILCWRFGAAVMTVMGLLFILVPQAFVRLLTDQPELLASSPPLLQLAGFVQIFFGTAIILGQGMRGAGDTRTTMLLTALSTYAVRLPLAALFGLGLGWGLYGVWIGLCGELVFRGIIFAARFRHGGWTKVQV